MPGPAACLDNIPCSKPVAVTCLLRRACTCVPALQQPCFWHHVCILPWQVCALSLDKDKAALLLPNGDGQQQQQQQQ